MNLPSELIDEIIRHLADVDFGSLHNCSLVARSWTDPSRKRLFKNVLISRETHQQWLDSISPENVELLGKIRSFTYIFDSIVWRNTGLPPHRIDSLRHYLPSLNRLEFLVLSSMFLGPEIPQQIGLFSAFQHTLSSLSLANCHVTPNSLIALINYFPFLVELDFWHVRYKADEGPTVPLSRPLRGRLVVAGCGIEELGLFSELSSPPPELDKLILHHIHVPAFCYGIVNTHGGSVKQLVMHANIGRHASESFPTLSHCQGLRELEISMLSPTAQDEVSLIATITSTNLQKISFPARYGFEMESEDPLFASYYKTIDDSLCQLVERLRKSGYKHRLDMVFRIGRIPGGEETDFKTFLPRFREQGRVKVVLELGERVVYCSN